jgi:hypothetical protein
VAGSRTSASPRSARRRRRRRHLPCSARSRFDAISFGRNFRTAVGSHRS